MTKKKSKIIFVLTFLSFIFNNSEILRALPVGSYNPTCDRIFTAHDKNGKIWDTDGNLLKTLSEHKLPITAVDFSITGSLVATASADKKAIVWDVYSGECLKIFDGIHKRTIEDVSFSPDVTLLADASDDDTAAIWDLSTESLVAELEGHTGPIFSVKFNPDINKNILATSSFDSTIKIWNTEGDCITTLTNHTGPVVWIEFSNDGNLLISASKDATARVWDMSTYQCLQTFIHGDPVPSRLTTAVFNTDSTKAATTSKDAETKIWDVDTGNHLKTLSGHQDIVEIADFKPNANILATGSWDETAKIWDISSGDCTFTLTGHTEVISVVQFDNTGNRLLTVSHDGTAKIWNTTTGQCLVTLE